MSTYYSCEIIDPNYTYSDPANPHVELTHSNETIFATNLQQNPLSLPQKLSGAAFFYPGEFNVYGVDGNADISWVKDDNGVWKRTYKFFDNKGSMIIKIKEGSDVPTDIVDYEPYGTPINLMDSFNENIYNERLAYIGREKDYESGLGDHGVRKLDYFTGSFTTPDAMWESYIGWSPYHYSMNDPVNMLDWDGNVVIAADPAAREAIINSVEMAYRSNIAFTGEGQVYFKSKTDVPRLNKDLSNFTNYGALRELVFNREETFIVKTDHMFDMNVPSNPSASGSYYLDQFNSSGTFTARKSSNNSQTSFDENSVITINPTIKQNHLTAGEGTINTPGRVVAHELYGHGFLWMWGIYWGWSSGYSQEQGTESGNIIRQAERNVDE